MTEQASIHQTSRSSDKALDSQTMAVMVLKTMSLFLGLLTTILLARWLEPAGFGIYSFVLAVVSVAVLPAHAGLATLLLRVTAHGYAVQEWGRVRGIWRWIFRVSTIVSLTLSGTLMAALLLFGDYLSPREFWAALWGVLLIPLLAANSLRAAVMRGIGQPVRGIALEALVRPLVLILGVTGLAGFSLLDPSNAVGVNLIATLVAVVAGMAWFQRLRAPQTRRVAPIYASSEWRRAVMPLAFLMGAHQLIKYTDIVLLGVFTTAVEVGQYRIAAQAAELIIFVLVGVALVIAPRIAQLNALGDHESLQRLVIRASRWSVAAALAGFVVLATAGDCLLKLVFGVQYIVAIQPLLILAMGQLVVAFFGVAPSLLIMTGNEQISLNIFIAASMVNIILNLLLIPIFGMSGAAVATATSLALAHATLSRAALRTLDIETIPIPLMK